MEATAIISRHFFSCAKDTPLKTVVYASRIINSFPVILRLHIRDNCILVGYMGT